MSYVIIWENNLISKDRCATHTWPGHAALNISDEWEPKGKGVYENYVSFWPKIGAGFSDKRENVLGSQAGSTNPGIVADIHSETYLPDHVFHLPDTPAQVLAMKGAWAALKEGLPDYQNLRANCSTVVAKILRKGGFSAGALSGLYYDHSMIWTPIKVRKMVLKAGGKTTSWADLWSTKLVNAGYALGDLGSYTKARDGKFTSSGAVAEHNNTGSFGEQARWQTASATSPRMAMPGLM